jgi:hypothetical protein
MAFDNLGLIQGVQIGHCLDGCNVRHGTSIEIVVVVVEIFVATALAGASVIFDPN